MHSRISRMVKCGHLLGTCFVVNCRSNNASSNNKLGIHLKEIVPNLLKYDDILYKKGRNRMHGFSYDTQSDNPFFTETTDCKNLTLDMAGDEAAAAQDDTVCDG